MVRLLWLQGNIRRSTCRRADPLAIRVEVKKTQKRNSFETAKTVDKPTTPILESLKAATADADNDRGPQHAGLWPRLCNLQRCSGRVPLNACHRLRLFGQHFVEFEIIRDNRRLDHHG